MKYWNWAWAGVALGILCIVMMVTVKPLGASTQFVMFDGLILQELFPEFVKNNEYFAKYAKKFAEPINYGFMISAGMLLGGLISVLLGGPNVSKEEKVVNKVWSERFGSCKITRYAGAFIGGILVVMGARLAGGCTSGHMLSGMAQLSISGFIFGATFMLGGIVSAFLIFNHKKGE